MLLVLPSLAADRREMARAQFDTAERMRQELNSRTAEQRTRRDYQRVADAYRSVYYTAPGSSKADASVLAVAQVLAEAGRAFHDEKALNDAIGQYKFLRREYPGSKYRIAALLSIGGIYKDDLRDADQAKAAYQEFLQHYPHSELAKSAKAALAELPQPLEADKQPGSAGLQAGCSGGVHAGCNERGPEAPATAGLEASATLFVSDNHAPEEEQTGTRSKAERENSAADGEQSAQPAQPMPPQAKTRYVRVTGIRHWSTEDSTRVAIDLENEVHYEVGRVSAPARVFFDLQDTKLVSSLVGKTLDVQDGRLLKIRVAPYHRGTARVVLDLSENAEYSASFLPNPCRLIIDIHGKPGAPETKLAGPVEPKRRTETKAESQPETPAAKVTEVRQGKLKPLDTTVAPLKYDVQLPVAQSDGIPAQRGFLVAEDEAGSEPANHDAAQPVAPTPAGGSPDLPSHPAKHQEVPATLVASNTSPSKFEAPPARDKTVLKKTVSQPQPAPPAHLPATTAESVREARPTSSGDRSLIRTLGLKIGKIVIDAGHGGHDTGTMGPNGLQEKDLVLDVALRLGNLLQQKMGAEVVYTRTDDTFIPLEARTAIANQAQADLFISIHANYSDDSAIRGIETYYLNFTSAVDALEVAARENAASETSIHDLQDLVKKIALKEKIEESHEFAADVQRSLWSGVAAKAPAVRNRGVKQAPFVVLIGANMPSILAEISFLSNSSDEQKLQTPQYRQRIAEYLYRGIGRYVSGLSGVKMASKSPVAEVKPVGASNVQVKAAER